MLKTILRIILILLAAGLISGGLYLLVNSSSQLTVGLPLQSESGVRGQLPSGEYENQSPAGEFTNHSPSDRSVGQGFEGQGFPGAGDDGFFDGRGGRGKRTNLILHWRSPGYLKTWALLPLSHLSLW